MSLMTRLTLLRRCVALVPGCLPSVQVSYQDLHCLFLPVWQAGNGLPDLLQSIGQLCRLKETQRHQDVREQTRSALHLVGAEHTRVLVPYVFSFFSLST